MASVDFSRLEEAIRTIPGYDPFCMAEGCWFDTEAAQLAIDFFEHETDGCLRHIEGAMAGELFRLEIWQQATVANLFGWKRRDSLGREVRRYREAFIYVPRKNGKTPFVAGICNYVLFCDNEPGAQIYSAAAEREQASLLFRHAKGMVEREPCLNERAKIYRGTGQRAIALRSDEASVYRVLSADADTKHGGNSHLVAIDELHAQPNRELVDVLTTSMASANRKQPLIIYITTADFDRESICNEKYYEACRVRDNGGDPNKPGYAPSFLPVIYEALPEDDWTDEKVWAKANPNLSVSVSLDYLRNECRKAKETPSYINTFKRLHLNMRTTTDKVFLDIQKWDALPPQPDIGLLEGRTCFGGLDLSTKRDITAFVLLFPPDDEDGVYHWLPQYWIPSDRADARQRNDSVPYRTWLDNGHVHATEGDWIDYTFIRKAINEAGERFNIQTIAYDPWNAAQLATQIKEEDGFDVAAFRQGHASMSEPTKELERLVFSGRLSDDKNPASRWMAGNMSVREDAAGNIKPDKEKSTERIDGMVALIMAIGTSLVEPIRGGSIYDTTGNLSL